MQGRFPCGRRVLLPPSRRLPHANSPSFTPARARLSRRCARGGRDDRLAGRPAGRRALARCEQAAGTLQPRRPPLARPRLGAVPDALARRPLERVGGRCARGRRPARPRHRRTRSSGPWRLGNPWWVGPSDRIEYRLRGNVSRLRAFFVWSPAQGVPGRTLQVAGAPAIVPRRGWNADEKIRRAAPSFAPTLRLALVHHTAGANGYTAAQSPSIVRAIQLYHVKGNGWNDIGYNFLVDRFGQVFEGRYGGHRAQRRRRPRRGLQHRVGRRRAAR